MTRTQQEYMQMYIEGNIKLLKLEIRIRRNNIILDIGMILLMMGLGISFLNQIVILLYNSLDVDIIESFFGVSNNDMVMVGIAIICVVLVVVGIVMCLCTDSKEFLDTKLENLKEDIAYYWKEANKDEFQTEEEKKQNSEKEYRMALINKHKTMWSKIG